MRLGTALVHGTQTVFKSLSGARGHHPQDDASLPPFPQPQFARSATSRKLAMAGGNDPPARGSKVVRQDHVGAAFPPTAEDSRASNSPGASPSNGRVRTPAAPAVRCAKSDVVATTRARRRPPTRGSRKYIATPPSNRPTANDPAISAIGGADEVFLRGVNRDPASRRRSTARVRSSNPACASSSLRPPRRYARARRLHTCFSTDFKLGGWIMAANMPRPPPFHHYIRMPRHYSIGPSRATTNCPY